MARISFWKKISLYKLYRKTILDKETELANYNLRIDSVNRIYTVINIPNEEPYNLKKADINKISEPYIAEYVRQVSAFLNKNGLTELYKLYDVTKVDKYSYLIVIGFSLFDTGKMARNLLIRLLPTAVVLSTLFWIWYKLIR